MNKNTRNHFPFIFIFVILWSFNLPAQMPYRNGTDATSLAPQFGYQYWRANDDQVQQFSIPMMIYYPVNDYLKLNITATPAFSEYVTTQTASLQGFSDTRISGSYLFENEKVMATFGVNLPSGKSALNSEQYSVASVLASHVLDFRSPILGQGLDISAGVVMVQDYNDFIFGFGLGYLLRGAYQYYDGYEEKYNPGNEITFSGGVDYYIGRNNKLLIDLSYTIFGSDTEKEQRVFKAGNRLSFQAMAVFEQEITSYIISIADRIQGKNQMGMDKLAPERLNSNGNEFEITGMGLLNLNRATTLRGLVIGRVYSDNAYDMGGATVGGIGGGLTRNITPWLDADAEMRFYFGSLNAGSENVGLSGFHFFTGLKVIL